MKTYKIKIGLVRVGLFLVMVLLALVAVVAAVAPVFFIGYLILNPELIGEFFGKIVAGYKATH